MVEPRQSGMQRIQVGLVGLVVVLLFVSLANMMLDRVAGGPSVGEAPDVAQGQPAMPDEPLAELGVTPVASEETAPEESPASVSNTGQRPAGQRR